MPRDRLSRAFLALVRLLLAFNIVFVVAAVVALAATFVAQAPLEARLVAKYGAGGGDALTFVRLLIALSLPTALAAHRLFAALAAILRSVLAGDPFVGDNAARLRTIGWSLLALQLIDLALGAIVAWGQARGLDTVGWQPTLMGWLAVLVAFVLARVFTVGTRLREDAEGLV